MPSITAFETEKSRTRLFAAITPLAKDVNVPQQESPPLPRDVYFVLSLYSSCASWGSTFISEASSSNRSARFSTVTSESVVCTSTVIPFD